MHACEMHTCEMHMPVKNERLWEALACKKCTPVWNTRPQKMHAEQYSAVKRTASRRDVCVLLIKILPTLRRQLVAAEIAVQKLPK
jgi:hypothetical protein